MLTGTERLTLTYLYCLKMFIQNPWELLHTVRKIKPLLKEILNSVFTPSLQNRKKKSFQKQKPNSRQVGQIIFRVRIHICLHNMIFLKQALKKALSENNVYSCFKKWNSLKCFRCLFWFLLRPRKTAPLKKMFVQNNTRVVPLFCVYFLPCILKIDGKNEIGGKKKEKK